MVQAIMVINLVRPVILVSQEISFGMDLSIGLQSLTKKEILGIWYWCTDQFIVQRVQLLKMKVKEENLIVRLGILKVNSNVYFCSSVA